MNDKLILTDKIIPLEYLETVDASIMISKIAELNTKLESFFKTLKVSEAVQEDYKSHVFESIFWKTIEAMPTPFDITEEREGSKGKMLEYFPEEYTISELNRLFPGWWQRKMKGTFNSITRCVEIQGYLMCPYPTLKGMKVRQLWAIGAAEIFPKKDDSGAIEPSQPDDRYKAARTEWFKVAGKWLGIGLDIYHQKITPELRSYFEDLIRDWSPYADYWKKAASTVSSGKDFRNMLKAMPRMEQIVKAKALIYLFPSGEQPQLWAMFGKQSNAPKENRIKFEEFLNKLDTIVETKFKQKG